MWSLSDLGRIAMQDEAKIRRQNSSLSILRSDMFRARGGQRLHSDKSYKPRKPYKAQERSLYHIPDNLFR